MKCAALSTVMPALRKMGHSYFIGTSLSYAKKVFILLSEHHKYIDLVY
jgi:hypothetical protein